MNDMAPHFVFSPGRIFLLSLAKSQELSTAIAAACQTCGVSRGTFSITGTLSCVTVGVFDQNQQVYVTHRETGSLEILSCKGGVSSESEDDGIHATLIAADTNGKITGGRLFAPTRMVAGQLMLQELLAHPFNSDFNNVSGSQYPETLSSQEGNGAL